MPSLANATPYELAASVGYLIFISVAIANIVERRKGFYLVISMTRRMRQRDDIVFLALGDVVEQWLSVFMFILLGVSLMIRALWEPSEEWAAPIAAAVFVIAGLLGTLSDLVKRLWRYIESMRGDRIEPDDMADVQAHHHKPVTIHGSSVEVRTEPNP